MTRGEHAQNACTSIVAAQWLKTSRPLPHMCFWPAAMDPVYASKLERWAQVLLHYLVPTPQGWQYFHEVGTDTTVLSRGTFQPTTVSDVERLYHGCTLGILHRILREGSAGRLGRAGHSRRAQPAGSVSGLGHQQGSVSGLCLRVQAREGPTASRRAASCFCSDGPTKRSTRAHGVRRWWVPPVLPK